MNNKLPYILIDTAGQTTAIIDVPITRSQQPEIAKPLMETVKNIGQVCFIERESNDYRLQMMGNEFSVNGTLAGGSYLLTKLNKKSINVRVSGAKDLVKIMPTKVFFPKTIIINSENNFVDFGSICYQLVPLQEDNTINFNLLKKLTIGRPAAGIVYYSGNKIKPVIFVKATNTYVWETCCGSASIAYSAITGKKIIEQPSGEKIKVEICNKSIIYSAACRMLR